MRKAFVEALIALAAQDDRVVLLTADMGYNALEPFRSAYPGRFFNVGVAEQNLIALATGLAESGLRPYCYSIAPFAALRPYEFIRNGPVLHRLPVRIVGMGGGLEYGSNGISHYGVDDIGVLRVQPGLAVFAPADSRQTRTVVEQTAGLPRPLYLRLEKDESVTVPGLDGRFAVGRPEHLIVGREVLFVAMGGVAVEAVAAARALAAKGVAAGVAVASTLSPIDQARFADLLAGYPVVITVEAHNVNGGLGSSVAEIIAELPLRPRLVRRAVTDATDGLTGHREFLYRHHGLAAAQLAAAALAALGGERAGPLSPASP
jgi:transketolase